MIYGITDFQILTVYCRNFGSFIEHFFSFFIYYTGYAYPH
jgi:hypothetical protein